MTKHSGLSHLPGACDHNCLEGGAHAQEFSFQFAANVLQENHPDQSKVNFILVEVLSFVNHSRTNSSVGKMPRRSFSASADGQ
jgi:hypothetical protein